MATYYLDDLAASGGNGSQATPWNTIAQVNASAGTLSGNTLLTRLGSVFNEKLALPTNNITFSTFLSQTNPSVSRPIIAGPTDYSLSGGRSGIIFNGYIFKSKPSYLNAATHPIFNNCSFIESSGDGLYLQDVPDCELNNTDVSRNTLRGVRASGASLRLIVKSSKITHNIQDGIFAGNTSTVEVKKSIVVGNQLSGISTGGAAAISANITDCILLGNGSGQGPSSGNLLVGAGSAVTLTKSLVSGGSQSTAYNTSGTIIDGGGNVFETDPKIVKSRFQSMVVVSSDDPQSSGGVTTDYWDKMVSIADACGCKVSMFISPNIIDKAADRAASILKLKSYIANGHEVGIHSYSHTSLTTTTAFTVTTTNGGTNTITVSVDEATLATTISLSSSGNPENNFTSVFSKGSNIDDLRLALAGKGWTITNTAYVGNSAASSTEQCGFKLYALNNVTSQSIATPAPVNAARLYQAEILETATWITENLGNPPSTISYPWGNSDAAVRLYCKELGLIGGRAVSGDYKIVSGANIFNLNSQLLDARSPVYAADSAAHYVNITESQMRTIGRHVAANANNAGVFSGILSHNINEIPLQQLTWLMDELVKCDASPVTFKTSCEFIRDNSTSADGLTFVFNLSTDQSDYHLQAPRYENGVLVDAGSPCIGAGTAISGITTDIEGNQLYPPYNIGPYGAAAGALEVSPTTNPGSAKQNITRVSGTGTTLEDTDLIKLADSHSSRIGTGWTYGTANFGYEANGVPKEITWAVAKENGIGPRYYASQQKGVAMFSVDMDTDPNDKDAKIKKFMKIPA